MASDDEEEAPASEAAPQRLALRRLFEERLSQFPADSRTRLAGQLGDPELQALCFLAGANSIFVGSKLLTTANPDRSDDEALLADLGMRPMSA